MPMLSGIAGVVGGGMAGAEEIRRRREAEAAEKSQRSIQQAALLAGLQEQGIVPNAEANDPGVEVPNLTGAPGSSVTPGMRTPSRFAKLGDTGYSQDRTKAPGMAAQAAERAKQRQREQMLARRVAVLKASRPELDESALMALAESDDAFEAQVRPQPERPAPRETPVNWQTVQTDKGLVQVNPQTGETRPLGVNPPPRPATGQRAPAEFEKKAAFMLEGAESANEKLTNYRPTARSFVSRVPGLGNYGISEQEQEALQAAEVLHDAYLRLTTGATITKEELQQAARQYVPQPGDQPAVIRAKHERRAQIIRAIRRAAQPALNRGGNSQPDSIESGIPYPEY